MSDDLYRNELLDKPITRAHRVKLNRPLANILSAIAVILIMFIVAVISAGKEQAAKVKSQPSSIDTTIGSNKNQATNLPQIIQGSNGKMYDRAAPDWCIDTTSSTQEILCLPYSNIELTGHHYNLLSLAIKTHCPIIIDSVKSSMTENGGKLTYNDRRTIQQGCEVIKNINEVREAKIAKERARIQFLEQETKNKQSDATAKARFLE